MSHLVVTETHLGIFATFINAMLDFKKNRFEIWLRNLITEVIGSARISKDSVVLLPAVKSQISSAEVTGPQRNLLL